MSPSQPTVSAASARAKSAVTAQAVSAGVAVFSHQFRGVSPLRTPMGFAEAVSKRDSIFLY
jgi:hypothetical protein